MTGVANTSGCMPVACIDKLARIASRYGWVKCTYVDREEEGKNRSDTRARIASAGSLGYTVHQLRFGMATHAARVAVGSYPRLALRELDFRLVRLQDIRESKRTSSLLTRTSARRCAP